MANNNPENLHELLVIKLRALYDVEQQLVQALPKMAKAANDEDLKAGFTEHLAETETHVTRLEQAFKELDEEPEALEGDAIRGLVKDAEWCIDNIENPEVLDAALIAAAQYVEHYEMAGYGSAAAWADTMGHTGVIELLEETLEEEKAADEKLNALAVEKINDAANDMVEEETVVEKDDESDDDDDEDEE